MTGWLARTIGAFVLGVCAALGGAAFAQSADIADRFGALPRVLQASLSPDGKQLAYISPMAGKSRGLFIVDLDVENATPRLVQTTDGEPQSLFGCAWATNVHLTCEVGGTREVEGVRVGFQGTFAINAQTRAARELSAPRSSRALYHDFRGGYVIDWLPNDEGFVLMERSYVAENSIGTLLANSDSGLGVDRINVTTGESARVERPRPKALSYLTDGRGNVRLMLQQSVDGRGYAEEIVTISTRASAGAHWTDLATFNLRTREGFRPVGVDPTRNVAIGFSKQNGRDAFVEIALDGSKRLTTLFAHDEVDVDGAMRIGRDQRIIGASYVTDRRHARITDARLAGFATALGRALNGAQLHFVDASADENRYLVWAGSDVSPGQYYLFLPQSRELKPLLPERPQLAALTLSSVKPIAFPAGDGVSVPGYLTLPPGRSDARGLPAIVMPHGGPSSRDEWGFDWLAQYFAQRGFAVLQPNYRGSSGYGDAWFKNNGFQSWKFAIGDIADGGRWLVREHGVDPAKLSIVGWSYGGYAALQAGVYAPDLFKAIVAIAPVSDLAQLKRESADYRSGAITKDFIGDGPHIREGSPASNAAMITAPVLMFHGSHDANVDIAQARTMRRALNEAGKTVELIEYPGLSHGLGTREARADLLRRTFAFLPH